LWRATTIEIFSAVVADAAEHHGSATERSVQELAALTGESMTAAIRRAAEERLQRVRREHAGGSLAAEIHEIGRRDAAGPRYPVG